MIFYKNLFKPKINTILVFLLCKYFANFWDYSHKSKNMATIKLILDKRRINKDKTYPLVFRLTVGVNYKTISTGISLQETEFNSRNRTIRNESLRCEVEKKLSEYQLRLNNFLIQCNSESISINELLIFILLSIMFMLIVFIILELKQGDEDTIESYYS